MTDTAHAAAVPAEIAPPEVERDVMEYDVVAVGAGLLAAPQWTPVRFDADGWVLLGVAITGFAGQLSITEAFRRGEASVIAPK